MRSRRNPLRFRRNSSTYMDEDDGMPLRPVKPLAAPDSVESIQYFGAYTDDDRLFDDAYRRAVQSGNRQGAGDYAKRVLKAVHDSRKAAARASLRAPSAYTRRMASEFWRGEPTGADDDEVWSFAWDEASAAGLTSREADKYANAALRMVQAREKVRGIARAVGMKPGAAGSGKKPGVKKAKANPRYKKYPFYVIRKSDGMIYAGFEYREDANDAYKHPGEWDARTSRDNSGVMTHAGVLRKYGKIAWQPSPYARTRR